MGEEVNSVFYNTPFGPVYCLIVNGKLTKVEFSDTNLRNLPVFPCYPLNLVQISLEGTVFQQLVWEEVMKIPFGETRTYGQIAKAIGKPKSYRAVASACAANKLALIVPCHRVIGGSNIYSYKWGTQRKKLILDFEFQALRELTSR